MEKTYQFSNDAFVINDYDKQKTFASFLPGLAGKRGIPLWAFYVNRGQAISSFGLRDKNGAILEFYPANLAYLYVSKIGFRTFVKKEGNVIELFKPETTPTKRQMRVSQSEVAIMEQNDTLGLEVNVTYFGLPGENIAALTRIVEFKNITTKPMEIELFDGISQILPSGIDYGGYKAISNLLRSWMNVDNLENDIAFFKLRSSTGDEAEMKEVRDGNFYLSFVNNKLVRPITDLDLIFGYDTSLNIPAHFIKHSLESIQKSRQITENKVPCGFTGAAVCIQPGETVTVNTLIGYTSDIALVNAKAKAMDFDYFRVKRFEAKTVIDVLLDDVTTKSAKPVFDAYIRQNYLDNLLRGGYPYIIKGDGKEFVYYLYSRKHGDLERDYNFFTIAPEYYSQGNGNFRDVCQNRRSDVLFVPETTDYSIKVFASLIQADGYNPLGINGSTFVITEKAKIPALVEQLFGDHRAELSNMLQGTFTPGAIINYLANHHVQTTANDEAIFDAIFAIATQNIEASYNEGYWIDHWTYILDLVENYLHVYPDKAKHLLYTDPTYRYFDSPVSVLPRDEKYCLDKQGKIRQYGSLRHPDKEKIEKTGLKENGTNWLKEASGKIVYTSLFGKLLSLAITKYAALDPAGMGVAMEANRCGWNDAMNGLPGIFGSGVSESIELARLVTFLIQRFDASQSVLLPIELTGFIAQISKITDNDAFQRWNLMNVCLETYRQAIRFGTTNQVNVPVAEVLPLLKQIKTALDHAIDAAYDLGNGVIPTFLYYEATAFEPLKNADGTARIGHYGLPLVKVLSFEQKKLPAFLEAPARYLKYEGDPAKKRAMIQKIKQTDLYDEQLKQYKTSGDLDAFGFEIGRIRAFTKGWLEREANFLHMTYKYLLGILKSGNYDLYYEEAESNLVCNMDPAIYGRSTLENSSFIATSNNPNPNLHGQGFVSRLSGSTAEMLSLFHIMLFGKELFSMRDGVLNLKLSPVLPKDYFLEGVVQSTFMKTPIMFLNPKRADAFKLKPVKYVLYQNGQPCKTIEGERLVGQDALDVREHRVSSLTVELA